ncbi:MAG: hypothetical protein KGD59_12495 [Candidatus Heimdallarchaeota archaeon]|nr:hypothetical protein [Candidatus Heimdallarchaeota archaeon]MBY8995363.1 hypothetical protein [Candidatus Heimdallarchaeota archaeon]
MSENEEEIPIEVISTRETIHSEIEEILIKKLFTVVEKIAMLPSGDLDFKPYDDRLLIQLEALIEKKFVQKVFDQRTDRQITSFLSQLKRERTIRDFDHV